jgi:hypothetical protein
MDGIMKTRDIGLLLFVGLGIIGWKNAAVAADEKVTCQTYGGPFALDDTDFKALAEKGVTREKFGSLDAIPGSKSATAENFGV